MALRSEGVRVRRGPLSVVWLDDGSDPPRVGYAITKRVGSAVVRNRLRRRLRAVLEELAGEGDAVPCGALLIGAGPSATRRSPVELRSDVASLLEALHSRRLGTAAP